MKNIRIRKLTFIGASFVFLLSVSCSFPNKEKSTSTTTEKSATSETAGKGVKSTEVAASAGEKLYSEKGCVVCHQLNTKLVGPAVKDIAAAYSGNKAGLTAFLKGEGKAIVDPSQASVMQPQIAITKALPAEELDAIVDYILSIK